MKKTLILIPLLALFMLPFAVHAESVYPDGCTATTKYSATTGQPCQKPACSPGDLYNSMTGQKCNDASSTLPEGCATTAGFSPLTGKKCDGSSRTWSNPWGATTVPSTPVVQQQPAVSQPVSVGIEDKSKIVATLSDLGDSYGINACFFDYQGNAANIDPSDIVNIDLNLNAPNTMVKPSNVSENCADFTFSKKLRPEGQTFMVEFQKINENHQSLLTVNRGFSILRNSLLMY